MSDANAGRRRRFLLGAGVASVTAAAALVAVRKIQPVPVKTSKAQVPAGLGYQVSEHVRNYYRTTAV